MAAPISYRRAMFLVTASSLMVPVIGLLSAPILTHSLGVAGRGEAGAAMAPNLLIIGVATLGLPQALTYHVAKRPHLSRAALGWAGLFGSILGVVSLVGILFATPFLSAGDSALAQLMVLGTVLAIPALVVSLLRGAAAGRQMWNAVAIERVLNSVIRLVALIVLAIVGKLDVTNAILVMSIAPVIAGIAYIRLAGRPPAAPIPNPDVDIIDARFRLAPELLSFGSKIWLGSVATMLIARLSQLLITPLSDVTQLGLFIVAITISDIPYIVTQTVRDVAFGANSAESDTARLATTSRVATLVAFGGSALIGITLPLWIGVIFGTGFEAALVPTWLLLVCSVIAVPGLIAGAGLDSAGRPGLRSMALVLALVVNLAGILALVPPLGAVGAGLAGFASTLLSTVFALVAASRILKVPARVFLVPRGEDIRLLGTSAGAIVAKFRPAKRGAADG